MSKENPAEQPGGWQPTPQGDYDGDATAFVQLPPEDLADIPLAAPGHGYVPPMILPLTPAAGLDPAATGNWAVQPPVQAAAPQPEPSAPDAVHWPDPNQQTGYGYQEPYPADAGTAGQDTSTAWPTAETALSDDSGELYTAPPAADWYADRPATLPGGAPAPWAVPAQEPHAESAPEAEAAPGPDERPHPDPVHEQAPDAEAAQEEPAPAPAEADPAPDPDPGTDAGTDAPGAEAAEPEAAEPEAADDAGTAGPAPDPGTAAPGPVLPGATEHPAVSYVLHVNGADRPVADAWIGESLLYVLRERLGLAGAKDGCSQGECGACNVQVDGRLVASCLVPAATTAGSEVRTVEGLAVDGEPSDVQRALADRGAVQCGFCIPGMAMTVHDLLEGNHRPSELETRRALCGNLCRCSGYRGVLEAVNEVIAGREAAAEAAAAEHEEARIPHQAVHQQDGGMA
ncbi:MULTISPECIES: 2Fe-2S iron-sulfur cluster-binding protein [unclassified Streptomyces]|uniref:2Fe-2S iron-sulfur cluster-binding protein n=1 Tax=unclassified Streptomyces TaxID=2593676 RepID=UPI000DAE7E1B|nr:MULTISPECIES: 2Fe-2S iron-sulfur cluster-binding protein [unclassified Streptomyces]PZT72014.1 (2Fe-2S)-binding protein [Streptomyces sp. AC1-42T]PZT81664.1 (2Fe-2S)-binding protein [Streptomyces sp. AC1-42W]